MYRIGNGVLLFWPILGALVACGASPDGTQGEPPVTPTTVVTVADITSLAPGASFMADIQKTSYRFTSSVDTTRVLVVGELRDPVSLADVLKSPPEAASSRNATGTYPIVVEGEGASGVSGARPLDRPTCYQRACRFTWAGWKCFSEFC